MSILLNVTLDRMSSVRLLSFHIFVWLDYACEHIKLDSYVYNSTGI